MAVHYKDGHGTAIITGHNHTPYYKDGHGTTIITEHNHTPLCNNITSDCEVMDAGLNLNQGMVTLVLSATVADCRHMVRTALFPYTEYTAHHSTIISF